jgi:hypothetical protein
MADKEVGMTMGPKPEQDPIAAAWKALDRYETETDPNGYDGTPDDVVDEMALVLRQLAEQAERGQHDMPAELYNELAERLLAAAAHDYRALLALEKLRSQYGASTRRHVGLDQPLHPHVSRETVRHERHRPPFEPSAGAYPDEHSDLL